MPAFAMTFILTLLLSLDPGPQDNHPVTAFVNVSVIPMDTDQVLRNYTVLVEGDQIIAVGPRAEVTIPDGAMRIDGIGKFLMPGLAEMHGHIPPPSQPSSEIENVLFLYVANGITTVRGMLGYPGQLELRERALSGDLLSPTLYLAGPSFSGNSISSPEQAVRRVHEQQKEGWDLLKIHPGLTLAEYDAMAGAAREVNIDFGGHVPADVGIEHAIASGQLTFDHLDGYVDYVEGDRGPVNRIRLKKILQKTSDAGAWVVPTMVLWETVLGVADLDDMKTWPELKYVSAQTVSNWVRAFENRRSGLPSDMTTALNIADARMELLAAMNRADIQILMGTDAPQQFSVPGFSLHREIEKMVEAGMSPYEVLRSGTINVGRYFSDKDDFGTIEVGKRADMILLNANPLENVRNISQRTGVMLRGKWLPEEEIQRKLAEVAASYGNGMKKP